ncbi:guanylate kinase [Malassezia yamatoensis]|uniref:Guanylate kinase n=1 Tax=Malassezia yamatoensis TaxID=253288 RepID=A0AAJ5YUK1_9BASI|nr:guanylate kinase [Malassezia yamatoensis]
MTALRPLVLCGPSGVGKSTLIKKLFDEFPNRFGFSISHTTRPIRSGERDGYSYHFVTRDEFLRLVNQGKFLEYAEFSGNLYGTTASAVEAVSSSGNGLRRAILDIDSQGVKLIKQNHPYLNPVYVFVSPPCYNALRERLEGRQTDSQDAIQRRLRMAIHELAYARQPNSFDFVIVNDDLNRAYEMLRKIVLDTTEDLQSDQVPAVDAHEQHARKQIDSQSA